MDRKERKFLTITLILMFILYFTWSLLIPYGKAPDEPLRFDIVNFIYKYHSLPILGDKRLMYDGYSGVSYAALPCLPYIIEGIICIILSKIGIAFQAYQIARFISVLSGIGSVYFLYLSCNKLFTNFHTKFFVTLMFAFIPEFSFVCGYVNQDAFMIFLVSIITYLGIEGIRNNWAYKTVIKIGIISGFVLLAYLNGYVILLSILILVILSYKHKDKNFCLKLLLSLLIMFSISGWWFIRNFILYNGDILGMKTNALMSKILGAPYRPSLHEKGISLFQMIFKNNWLPNSFNSYWACFGWMDITLPFYYYIFMLFLIILSVSGWAFYVYNKKSKIKLNNNSYFYIFNIISILLSICLSLYYSLYIDFQPQGRYIYPGLIASIIIIGKGIDNIITDKYKKYVYSVLIFIFLNINVIALFKYIFINYYF